MAIFMCSMLTDLLTNFCYIEKFSIQKKYVNRSVNMEHSKNANVNMEHMGSFMESTQFMIL